MKYFYISCFLLSSFFTYKTLSAKDNRLQYAFFMPQGAFEQNISLDNIESMRPRQPKPVEQESEQTQTKESFPPKITLPYVKKKIKLQQELITDKTQTAPQTTTTAQNTKEKQTQKKVKQATTQESLPLSPDTMEKLNKYSLEKISLETAENKSPKPDLQTETINKFAQKSLTEMLSSVPYPNSTLPEFKQNYASYVMDLRIFDRRGKLPANPKQEKTLQKANSNRRFEVN